MVALGFTVEKGSEKRFSKGVLRRGFPENAQNAPSESTTPYSAGISAPKKIFSPPPHPKFPADTLPAPRPTPFPSPERPPPGIFNENKPPPLSWHLRLPPSLPRAEKSKICETSTKLRRAPSFLLPQQKALETPALRPSLQTIVRSLVGPAARISSSDDSA